MPASFKLKKLLAQIIGLGVFVVSVPLSALPQLVIDTPPEGQTVGSSFEVFVDPQNSLSIDDIVRTTSSQWRSIHANSPNFGYSNSPHWFRSEIQNHTQQSLKLNLKLRLPNIDHLNFYFLSANTLVQQYQLGDALPFDQRPIASADYAVPFELAAGESTTVYIKIFTQSTISLPISLWEANHFVLQQHAFNLIQGLFFGLMFSMGFYNLTLFIGIGAREYLYYCVTIVSGSTYLLALSGIGFQFLWPHFPQLNNYAIPLSTLFFCIGTTLLANHVLQVRRYAPLFSAYMHSFALAIFALGFLSFFISYSQTMRLISILGSIGCIGVLFLCIFLWAKGNKWIRNFLFLWIAVSIGVSALVVRALGLSNFNFWGDYGLEIGSAVAVLWMSSLLSNRVNRERRDKIRAQHRAVRHQRQANRERERYLRLKLTTKTDEVSSKQRVVEAEASSRAKSQFLANMSHEIRTPMNGILGITQLLEHSKLDSQQKHYVNIIGNSCHILLRLINDLLDFSKISAGKLTLEKVSFNLFNLCRECAFPFEALATQKQLSFQTHLDFDPDLLVDGDPTRLKQIITNLLDNAFKFTRAGNVTLSVRDEPSLGENTEVSRHILRFEIEDTGIGIDENDKEKLFDSFTQANTSTTREFGGTGLGLSICKELVELMGGQIGLASIANKGSTFWLMVPFTISTTTEADPPAPTVEAPTPLHLESESGRFADNTKILVAEDNPVNQIVIGGLLKKLNLSFVLCASGEEALTAFHRDPDTYACILMDCEMPGVDGFEATEKIRQWELANDRRPIPIIAVTAHSWDEYGARLHEVGFSDHLPKPVDLLNLKIKLVDNIPIPEPA